MESALVTATVGDSAMPNRPASRCSTLGCPWGTTFGGRCDRCRGAGVFGPPSGERAPGDVYTTAQWRRRRLIYLADYPQCALCGRAATVPDHYPRSRRALVAAGVADPDADEHLRPLCHSCHSKQTAIRQPGGWNARA